MAPMWNVSDLLELAIDLRKVCYAKSREPYSSGKEDFICRLDEVAIIVESTHYTALVTCHKSQLFLPSPMVISRRSELDHK